MTFGSLFSGIGGFDLGFEQAGMQCAWQVEIDPKCRALLKSKFPHTEIHSDVRSVGKSNLTPVDLVCGGFPCQDVSVAGRRAGLAGERSGLWFEFARILDELKPPAVIVENVPGLLSSNGGRDFAVIVHGLVKLGYGIAWRVLDAQYFGVAQRRRRVFIVGCAGESGTRKAAQILALAEGMCGNPKPSGKARTLAPTLSSSGAGVGRTGNERTEAEFLVAAPLRASGPSRCMDDDGYPQNLIAQTLLAKGNDPHDPSLMTCVVDGAQITSPDNRSQPSAHTAPTLAKDSRPLCFDCKASANHTGAPQTDIAPTMRSMGRSKSHMNGGGHLAIQVAYTVRRLTPTECERLQGFPDGWTAGFADSVRYRMLGNAVAVPVARWSAKRIMEVAP